MIPVLQKSEFSRSTALRTAGVHSVQTGLSLHQTDHFIGPKIKKDPQGKLLNLLLSASLSANWAT